ncbi:rod shape-determining protein MreC [Aliarcobacter cryaerophilus ATCC 43158]|uniref:Rod shape-determining protein MreC n=1 Tax=Aliarcobacter cryaerophilus ATCC 43158 TaxID=1032070 RepID=A0AAD0X9J2_9BACT|nr:rod shape-determining protein MreC [Aliarcobacter cryaerophilus]AYJ79268.1 rod shape-determining protein MreC [Aliarcobacter cryaerophilus ATCC 43158]PRM93864.1 rod shape-determining protein MreC [Aliarcobacter cryaerophilus]QCZ23534.1 rod shape-determining protein MreC [Aliarcobacter cryaerophilus ATCC 43158]
MKRFLFLLLIVFAGLSYLFELDEFLAKHFKVFGNLKESYINTYISVSQKVANHFEHERLIRELQNENLELKEYKVLYNTTISTIDNLKNLLENIEIPEINSKIEVIRVLSYVHFDDFTSVWLDKVPTDNKILGLISENYAAGISMIKNGKSIGLLNGNKDCTYAVFIGNEKNPGIATSNDESSDLLSVKFIPVWADINVGDEVITSGMDNIFYEGLRVGKVVEIKDFPEMKVATIKPYANPLKKRFFYTYEANSNIENQENSTVENLENSKIIENKEQK